MYGTKRGTTKRSKWHNFWTNYPFKTEKQNIWGQEQQVYNILRICFWRTGAVVLLSSPVNASGGRKQLAETLCSSLGGDCKKLQEEGVSESLQNKPGSIWLARASRQALAEWHLAKKCMWKHDHWTSVLDSKCQCVHLLCRRSADAKRVKLKCIKCKQPLEPVARLYNGWLTFKHERLGGRWKKTL